MAQSWRSWQLLPTQYLDALSATHGLYCSCRIWNVLAGGRLLARLANHQKTVTSLCTASSAGPAATSAPRLLSGSLDGHVKVRLPLL